MKNWKEDILNLWKEGYNWGTLATVAVSMYGEFRNMDIQQAREKVRGFIRRTDEYKAKQGIAPDPKEEKPKKPEVIQNQLLEVVEANWKGDRIIRFGLMGDTQINSKYTQLTYLHRFYDECEREGIENVYHTGDIDEGERMRPGHAYECYTQGADDHAAEICRLYPTRKGITTHFITGNHDASMIRHCGYDIGHSIAQKRSDMKYLGRDCAIVNLTPNCTLELRHPWDGSAYALSYKTQKMIDAMSGGEKPNILAVGHYHKAEYLFYRNIHCFQTGCFQAQTPFMKGKGLAAHMGGWLVEVKVDAEGHIQKIKQTFIPYYKAIQDDYKNWSN